MIERNGIDRFFQEHKLNQATSALAVPRILHFAPGFRLGGIESLLMSLYRCLDKSSLQFDFMVDTCDSLPEFDEIRAAGGRVFQMGRYLTAPFQYQRRIEQIFKQHGHEYIALHCHTVARASPVLWLARRYGISKRILHSHTESLKGSKWASIAPLIIKVTAYLATDYWACSKAAGSLFFGRRPYTVLNNTIRTQQFSFSRDDRDKIRCLLRIEQNSLVIGHTGRFTYPKNHEWLIRVFAELYRLRPEVRLLLVGAGPLELEMRSLVATLGLTEVVVFAGLQSDIASYLCAMDIFFMPSHYEGFPISLLEAQANGLPCLVSNAMAEEVQVTPSVITHSLDATVTEWANQLLKLHKVDGVNRNEKSKANISLIQQSGYDTEVQLNSLLAMYK